MRRTNVRHQKELREDTSFNGISSLPITISTSYVDKFKSLYLGTLIFIVFTFSDVYFVGLGRPIDYLSLFAIILYQIFSNDSIRYNSLISSMLLVGIMSPWLLVGALKGYLLVSAAILVGASLVFPFFQSHVVHQIRTFNSALKITILINVVMLFVQMFLYYGHGFFLDFHSMVGSIESRGLNEGLQYFRPSGLFQEPNAYCTVMFCLLSLRVVIGQPASVIDYFGVLSMILTQSLWSFGASFVILWLMIGFANSMLILMVFSATGFMLLQFMGISLNDLSENSITIWRIMNIDDDPSRQARYGSASSWQLDERFFLGNGVDTSNFQAVAANSVSFLVYSFGVVGVALIFAWAVIHQKIHFKSTLSILFLFTTFPPFSYMYFWIYLSLMLYCSRYSKKLPIKYIGNLK